MKACNHYIYITAGSLACFRELPTGLDLMVSISIPRNFSRDRGTLEQSLLEFETYLENYPHDRFFVITDTQAEAYQAETVPTLSGHDLRMLLARKMEQRYRTTRYRAVVPHRSRPYAFIRKLAKRRSKTTTRILYALISPETLAPWLDVLEQRALNVRGLYSLGALMPALLSHSTLPVNSDALFVLRTAAGYRHAFVSPSGLRFSRLCAQSNADDAHVGQEIDKTLQYLTMARLWGVESRHRTLHITVIDAQPSAQALIVPGNLRGAQLHEIRPRDLMPNGPAALLDGVNSAWLLFNCAALRGHGFGCAAGLSLPDASRRADYRRAALVATAAVAAVSVGYLAFTEFVTREKIKLAATAEMIADHIDAAADASERGAPKTELEPQQLRAVVQSRDRLMARNISAYGLMQRTAAALAPFPDLNVDLLEWSYVDAAGAAGTDAPAPPPDGMAAAAPVTFQLRMGGHIGVTLLKSDANAAVLGLAAALAKELHGRQSIEKLPFDVTPAGTLAGKPNDGAAEKADFRVTVTVPADFKPAS
jgi:hypothetical protein